VQQSIDISCCPGPHQQPATAGLLLWAHAGTYRRRTDVHRIVLHRSCSAYYAGSANNLNYKYQLSQIDPREVLSLAHHTVTELDAECDKLHGQARRSNVDRRKNYQLSSIECVQKLSLKLGGPSPGGSRLPRPTVGLPCFEANT